MRPLALALLLLAPPALAQEDAPEPPLRALAARALKTGKSWVHKQPMSGELGYDYARAGKRLPIKNAADGYEREAVVTLDADRDPYDLILVSRRTKKEKGVFYLVDQMTLRVDLDGKLVAAVRANGRDAEIIRSSVPVDDFYVRQVYEREMAFYQKGIVRDPNAAVTPSPEVE
jgi:hypothetical protein